MNYTKTAQVAKVTPTKKVCLTCKVNRSLQFFSSKRATICNDCKRKSRNKKLKASPGRVNKTRDNNWSYLVKELAGNKCEYCGKTEHLNSHHVYSRSNHSVRWYLPNGVCLCAGHHTLKSDFSAHKTPMEFVIWVRQYRGEEWYQDLLQKARAICKQKDA